MTLVKMESCSLMVVAPVIITEVVLDFEEDFDRDRGVESIELSLSLSAVGRGPFAVVPIEGLAPGEVLKLNLLDILRVTTLASSVFEGPNLM